jgi:predicted nucleic acid-binding protein
VTRYCDTSFLAPLIREEATSSRIQRFMAGVPVGELAISRWTEVEFASLLAREVRAGALGADAAREADALFADMIEQSFIVLLPGAEDYALAGDFLRRHETGLRAADALHLAVAHNHRAEAIYTLDKTMLKAGRTLGLPVGTGIRLSG